VRKHGMPLLRVVTSTLRQTYLLNVKEKRYKKNNFIGSVFIFSILITLKIVFICSLKKCLNKISEGWLHYYGRETVSTDFLFSKSIFIKIIQNSTHFNIILF
jgi:hypothetical protein